MGIVWLFIGLFAVALVAFAVAPVAARGDARTGVRIWALVLFLCAATVGMCVDLAVNPAAYHALLRLAGAQ